ncbi:MAG: SDR family NAD(P)-dependent oxidoreductase, partial [Pseudomonadota bacterium]
MTHPALTSESVAVVTCGASGIGLAAVTRFACMEMRVVIVDSSEDKLNAAADMARAAGVREVLTAATDVSDIEQVEALEASV